MEIWLDTTDRRAIEDAREMGILHGITTNPSVIANSNEPLEDLLDDLLNRQTGPIAVQVVGRSTYEMIEQAKDLYDYSSRLIIKVPATSEGLKAIASLSHIGIPVMATAVLEPIQALLAAKAGAVYVAPYYSHIGEARQQAIQSILQLYRQAHISTKLLVAALTTPEHVIQCAELGAPALTLKDPLFYECCKTPEKVSQFLSKFDEDWQKAAPTKLLPKKMSVG